MTIQVPTKGMPFVYFYLAQELGLYEQHELDATIIVMSPPTALAGLESGEVDLVSAIGTATRAAVRGVPVRVVYVAANRSDHSLVGAKTVTNVGQLRDKVVAGYAPANTVNAIEVELLRRNGLPPDSYQLLNAGDGPSRAAALVNGVAAATLLDSSVVLPMLREGYPLLARAGDEIELPFTGLAASNTKLQQARDRIKRTMQATHQAVTLVRNEPQRAVPVAAREFGLTPADAERLLDDLRGSWSVDGRPTDAALQFELRNVQEELELTEPVRLEQAYDLSLVDELRAPR